MIAERELNLASEGGVEYIDHPLFHAPDAERLILQEGPRIVFRTPRRFLASVQGNLRALEKMNGTEDKPFTVEEERLAFLRYNYCRFRLASAQTTGIARWFSGSQIWEEQIFLANTGLIFLVGKKWKSWSDDDEWVSDMSQALLRAIRCFDLQFGFKFSTYAFHAINKACSRRAHKNSRHQTQFRVFADVVSDDVALGDFISNINADARLFQCGEQLCVDDLRAILDDSFRLLTRVEQEVIHKRFGLSKFGKKKWGERTLKEIGEEIGVTKERVRQIELKALAKISETIQWVGNVNDAAWLSTRDAELLSLLDPDRCVVSHSEVKCLRMQSGLDEGFPGKKFKCEEMAKCLGLSTPAVEKLLCRSRHKLRNRMKLGAVEVKMKNPVRPHVKIGARVLSNRVFGVDPEYIYQPARLRRLKVGI